MFFKDLSKGNQKWVYRRRIVFIVLFFTIIFYIIGLLATCFLKLQTSELQTIENLTQTFLLFAGSVISGYLGFATWDDKNDKAN